MVRAWAVVPADGSGLRFSASSAVPFTEVPKQFFLVQGHTVLSYTVASLLARHVQKVVVVTSEPQRVGPLPAAAAQSTSTSPPVVSESGESGEDGAAAAHHSHSPLSASRQLSSEPTSSNETSTKPQSRPGALLQPDARLRALQQSDVPPAERTPKVDADMRGDAPDVRIHPARETPSAVSEEPASWDGSVVYVSGSSSRHRSIKCGLDAIASADVAPPEVVIVHDGVRPVLPSVATMTRLVRTAAAAGAAGLTRPLVSTVLHAPAEDAEDAAERTLTTALVRSQYCASETPQAFRYDVLRRAYSKCSAWELDHGTECLQLVLDHCGVRARLLAAAEPLWKVTMRRDLHALRGTLHDDLVRPAVLTSGTTRLRPSQLQLVQLLRSQFPHTRPVSSVSELQPSGAGSVVLLVEPGAGAGAAVDLEQLSAALLQWPPVTSHVVVVVVSPPSALVCGSPADGSIASLRLHGAAGDRVKTRNDAAADVEGGDADFGKPTTAGCSHGPEGADPNDIGWPGPAEVRLCSRRGVCLCTVRVGPQAGEWVSRLAALLAAVLPSEQSVFHAQTLSL